MKKKLILLGLAVLCFASAVKANVEWTIWEGSMNASSSGTAGQWDNSLYLNNNNFADLSVGDVIYFTLTKNDNASGQAHVVLYYQNTLVIGETTTWPETELISIDTDGDCSYTITSDNLKYFQGYYDGDCTSVEFINLVIKGYDFTLTKVSIKKWNNTSVIKTTLSDAAVQLGNWSGQYDVEASKLSHVQAGDYFYVPATKQMTKDDESAVKWWQAQFSYEFNNNWENLYNVNSVDHDIWAEIQEADVSNITSNSLHLKGEYYNCTGVYLYHPITSFSIGSIGYATFSAAQEVTAPNSVTAYRGTISGDKLVLTPFTDNVIPANTGAIIAGTEGAVLEFTASATGSTENSDLLANTTATDVTSLASGYDYYVLYPGSAESETNLELSSLLGEISDWGGHVTVSTSEPYTAEWTNSSTSSAMGKWIGSDWSSYDKLRLVFTSNTVTESVHFGLSYKDQENSENTGADLATGELTVDIPLNESYKSAMGNFSFNSNATSGSLTFESALLIDNDGATVAEFRKTNSGTLKANKAYLKIPQSAGVRAFSVAFEDEETTGIESLTLNPRGVRDSESEGRIYNLAGQRISKVQKGLNIVNGKKVLVK